MNTSSNGIGHPESHGGSQPQSPAPTARKSIARGKALGLVVNASSPTGAAHDPRRVSRFQRFSPTPREPRASPWAIDFRAAGAALLLALAVATSAQEPASDATALPKPALPELLKLKFDRGETATVQALAVQAAGGAAVENPIERFRLAIVLSRWKEAGAYLATLPEKDAMQVYEHVLKDLDRGPSAGTGPEGVARRTTVSGLSATRIVEVVSGGGGAPSNAVSTASIPTLRLEDIAELADVAPRALGQPQVLLLTGLIKRVVNQDESIAPLVDRLVRGTRWLGGADLKRRLLAARMLDDANRELELGVLLPPLEPGRETESFELLNYHVRHASKRGRAEHGEGELARAWKLNLLFLDAANCPDDHRKRAVTRTAELLRFLPPQQADDWLRDALRRRPADATAILKHMQEHFIASRGTKDLERRKGALDMQRRIVALLPADAKSAWQPLTEVFATNWIAEGEYAKRMHVAPRNRNTQFDEFGNQISYGYSLLTPQQNPNQIPGLPVADALAAAPDAAWLAVLAPDLRATTLRVLAELHLKIEEETKALADLEQLAPLQPKIALGLANDLLRVWAESHDPLRAVPQRRGPIYFGPGSPYGMRQQGIPLTRALQQRNLDELAVVLRRLEALPIAALDQQRIVKAFSTAHSAAEVFREDAIEKVFGKLAQMQPATLAELLQTMRQRLANQWRKPSVQQQAGTQRTEEQIDAEVLRGYDALGGLLREAITLRPDDWQTHLAQAATAFDQAEFQYGKKVDLAIYVEKRDAAFAGFARAADLYAAHLPAVTDETPRLYQQWLNATLGASDLGLVTRQQEASANQLDGLRGKILALPGDAAARHFDALARAVASSADSLPPHLKPAYMRSAARIVGERPAAAEIASLVSYYDGLLREVEVGVRVDGDEVVGHGQPFGVFLTVRHTVDLERENAGGFGKYLRNQSQNQYYYNPYGVAPIDHRDELEKQLREKLGERFEIVSLLFHDEKVRALGYGRAGWKETPLVYLLLKAKDAAVDRLPSLRLDLDFSDRHGPVVLPVESAPLAIDARPEAGSPRPIADLEATQILDDRAQAEGRLTVEVKATARGLVPPFAELFDFAPAGFKIAETTDSGPAVQRLDSTGETLGAMSERTWLFKLERDAGGAKTFRFPQPKSVNMNVTYKRYTDADLVEVEPEVAVAGLPLHPARVWPWVALGGAALGLGGLMLFGRREVAGPAAPAAYALPGEVTPFTMLELLRRIDGDARVALSAERRGELAQSIAAIEAHYFRRTTTGASAPDLEGLARTWLSRTAGGR